MSQPYTLVKTHADHPDFIKLVQELDKYLAITDGAEHDFYHQFNHVDTLQYILIAYHEKQAVGCGAIKPYDKNRMEVKRMYTLESARGKGVASCILNALEAWTLSLNYSSCILETGIRQVEAIGLYKKNGFKVIPNYGQYQGVANSVCFEKFLA